MSVTDDFLKAFDELSAVLRQEKETDALGYESELEKAGDLEAKDKLKLCRITRNYIAHHSGERFAAVSDAEIRFLTNMTHDLCSESLTARKLMKQRQIFINEDTSVSDSVNMAVKKRLLAVLNGDDQIIGLLTAADVLVGVSNCHKGTDKILKNIPAAVYKRRLRNVTFSAPDTRWKTIRSSKYIDKNPCVAVTSDGTPGGKYRGLIYDLEDE